MSRQFRIAAAVLIATATIGAAPPPKPADTAGAPVTDWSNIETVIVTAKKPGPAMWHIVKGNSEVWILPTIAPAPKSLAWDTSQVALVLKGAKALLTPPRGEVGVFEGVWFLMWHRDTLEQPDGVTLESTLSDPLKARFIAARSAIHRDADRYENYLPAIAAPMLENDYWTQSDLAVGGLQKTIEHLASHEDVPVKSIATYPAMDVVNDVPKMNAAAQRACLEGAIADIDRQRVHAVAAAQAWAVGDIADLKAHYSDVRLDACFQANTAYAALRNRAITDATNAVTAALERPDKTVVIVPLGQFLRQKSVLDRLAAEDGVTVTGPGD
jgi:TraB/PrgY/gumN family